MVVGFTTIPMQSVPITTDVVSLNLTQGEVYNIMWPVCQWLAAGRWFTPGPPVSSTNKTDRHDITEILLKVALNTINNQPTTLTLLTRFYVRMCILLICGKHDHIISLRGEVWAHKNSLSQVSEQLCIYKMGVSYIYTTEGILWYQNRTMLLYKL